MLSAKVYKEQTKSEFMAPINPGNAPAVATTGNNRTQEQSSLNEAFKHATYFYDQYQTIDKDLKK
jgi:hypothetical protein